MKINEMTKQITEAVNDPMRNVHGLNRDVVAHRIRYGWTLERAISTPKKEWPNYQAVKEAVADPARNIHDLPHDFVSKRVRRGWTIDRAISTAPRGWDDE